MAGRDDAVKRHSSRFFPERGGRVHRLFLLCFAISVLCYVPDSGIAGFFNPGYAGFITPPHRAEQGYTKQSRFSRIRFKVRVIHGKLKGGRGDTKKRTALSSVEKYMRHGGSADTCPCMPHMRGSFSCRSARYNNQESGARSIMPRQYRASAVRVPDNSRAGAPPGKHVFDGIQHFFFYIVSVYKLSFKLANTAPVMTRKL
jgi:hypothetical protein